MTLKKGAASEEKGRTQEETPEKGEEFLPHLFSCLSSSLLSRGPGEDTWYHLWLTFCLLSLRSDDEVQRE